MFTDGRLLWAGLGLLCSSCANGLVNLNPLSVTTYPGSPNQVLAAADTLKVTFSDSVNHSAAQSLFNVTSADGTVSGDLSWSGNTLAFSPVPALSPAKRYNLEFNGQVTLDDGRQFAVVKEVPFYSVSGPSAMSLVSSNPAAGASVTVTAPLVLTFSTPIDPVSFQAGFTLSPTASTQTVWSADRQSVTITPTAGWAAVTLYTWQLATTVKSAAGIPLSASTSRSFLTNADQSPPQIVGVAPAVWTNATATWTAAGSDLNTLIQGDGLLVTTSKAVNFTSLGGAWHTIPSIKGHILQQAPTQYILVFDESFAVGTIYTFQITTDLQDTVGNALTTAFLTTFKPSIPYLNVTEIDLEGTSTVASTTFNQPNVFPTCAPSGVSSNPQIVVRVVFDSPFSAADRAPFSTLTFCQPLFPTTGTSTLSAPTLVSVSFEGTSTVDLTYQGFSVNAAPGAPYYYQVKIPGGSSGVTTSTGQALKGDVWLNFATGS